MSFSEIPPPPLKKRFWRRARTVTIPRLIPLALIEAYGYEAEEAFWNNRIQMGLRTVRPGKA